MTAKHRSVNNVLWRVIVAGRIRTARGPHPARGPPVGQQSGKCVANYNWVCYVVSKRHELRSTNGFKLKVSFHPPSVNSVIHFIACRLRRRRSTNGTQPHFAKRWMVGCALQSVVEKLGSSLPKKNGGPKNLYICSVSRGLRDLMANIC